MSFYPITVNYWTMRGSGSFAEGKRDLLRTVAWVWFLCHRPGQTAFSPALEKDSVRVLFLSQETGDERMRATVAVIMGSTSDWETMKHSCSVLEQLEIPYIKKVVSAHRTPELMFEFAETARSEGIKVIIAGAGGAAHLPGMVAAKTTLPVIGVPVQSKALNGLDSLLSIVQMPGGVPVATVAIGTAGAKNAGLLAAQILSVNDVEVVQKLDALREETKKAVMESSDELG
jgi:5-(carboxyamino)imidazole ribonucleotide mutase